jgi:hypothetical protein
MQMLYLDSEADLQWVRNTHWENLPKGIKCVIITGNEDCPDMIEAFLEPAPSIDSRPAYTKYRRA